MYKNAKIFRVVHDDRVLEIAFDLYFILLMIQGNISKMWDDMDEIHCVVDPESRSNSITIHGCSFI